MKPDLSTPENIIQHFHNWNRHLFTQRYQIVSYVEDIANLQLRFVPDKWCSSQGKTMCTQINWKQIVTMAGQKIDLHQVSYTEKHRLAYVDIWKGEQKIAEQQYLYCTQHPTLESLYLPSFILRCIKNPDSPYMRRKKEQVMARRQERSSVNFFNM